MKERLIITFVFIIFIISMISASYKCVDNTDLIEDMGSLKLGEIDRINDITVGLSFTRDVGSKGLMEAEVYIDSKKVSLNDGNATTVKFSDDANYSITLLNSSENTVAIKIGSDSKSLNTLDSMTIGGLSVFLINSVGDYPGGSPNVNILLGKSKLFLSSEKNPDEIIKFNGQEHLIELYAASDNEALITIKKCKNESVKIIQVADQINSSINNTNQTNDSIINRTVVNNTTNNTFQNGTANQSQNNSGNSTGNQNVGSKYSGLIKTSSIIIVIVSAIIFIILLFKYLKNKSYQNQSETRLQEDL